MWIREGDRAVQVIVWIVGVVVTILTFVLDQTPLPQFFTDRGWIYAIDLPPSSWPDKMAIALIIGLLVAAYYLWRSLYSKVFIGNIYAQTRNINFGKWWGVELRLRGHSCECSAALLIAFLDSAIADREIPLRPKAHWEDEGLPEISDSAKPTTWILAPDLPVFIPLFVIEDAKLRKYPELDWFLKDKGVKHLVPMHREPAKRTGFSRGTYWVELYIDHGSHRSARKKFKLVFDGNDSLKQCSMWKFWERDIYFTPSAPDTSGASPRTGQQGHSNEAEHES